MENPVAKKKKRRPARLKPKKDKDVKKKGKAKVKFAEEKKVKKKSKKARKKAREKAKKKKIWKKEHRKKLKAKRKRMKKRREERRLKRHPGKDAKKRKKRHPPRQLPYPLKYFKRRRSKFVPQPKSALGQEPLPIPRAPVLPQIVSRRGDPPLDVGVTGASSKTALALMYVVGNGEAFGRSRPLNLHMMDAPRHRTALRGAAKDLRLGGLRCVNKITTTTSFRSVFKKSQVLILLTPTSPVARGTGPRSFRPFVYHYKKQGVTLESHADRKVYVIVAGDFANTHAAVVLYYAPTFPRYRVTTVTSLSAARGRSVLATKLQVTASSISDVIVWGNSCPRAQRVDATQAKLAVLEMPRPWLEKPGVPCEGWQKWGEEASGTEEGLRFSETRIRAWYQGLRGSEARTRASEEVLTDASKEGLSTGEMELSASEERLKELDERIRAAEERRRSSDEGLTISEEGSRATGEGLRASEKGPMAGRVGKRASEEVRRGSEEGPSVSRKGKGASEEERRASEEIRRALKEGARYSHKGKEALDERQRASEEGPSTSHEGKRASEEARRASGEVLRASEEGRRASEEGPSTSHEGRRASEEVLKASGEVLRASEEGPSTSHEGRRASEEVRRASGEVRWASEEGRRASEELRRASEEGRRASEEGRRSSEEGPRASEEGPSTSHEGKRASGEGRRVSGEVRWASEEGLGASEEGRRTSEEERRASEEGPSTSHEGKRASGEGRRASEEGRRASEEGPSTRHKGMRGSEEVRRASEEVRRASEEVRRASEEIRRASGERPGREGPMGEALDESELEESSTRSVDSGTREIDEKGLLDAGGGLGLGTKAKSLVTYTFKSVADVLGDTNWLRGDFVKLTKSLHCAGCEITHAQVIATHLKHLWRGTPGDQLTSMGVPVGDGLEFYGVTTGIFFSFPVSVKNKRCTVKPGLYPMGSCDIEKFHNASLELQRDFTFAIQTIQAEDARRDAAKRAQPAAAAAAAAPPPPPAEPEKGDPDDLLTIEEKRTKVAKKVLKEWVRNDDSPEAEKANRKLARAMVLCFSNKKSYREIALIAKRDGRTAEYSANLENFIESVRGMAEMEEEDVEELIRKRLMLKKKTYNLPKQT